MARSCRGWAADLRGSLPGLPTNPIMTALLGALTVGGIVPGPRLPLEQGEFYRGLRFSLALGNLLLLAPGLYRETTEKLGMSASALGKLPEGNAARLFGLS